MDGVLVIDKPGGLTSHDVVAVARRALREKRIGHTGTLDPLATGVLPLACGRATRLVRFLTASDKAYDATIRFGLTTDSYDVTGSVVRRTDRVPSREAVAQAIGALTGEYLQTPPAFSAKKIQGERAYARARAHQTVELAPVPVRVSHAELRRWDGGTAVVALTCSAGFYVRSFAHVLGEAVGTGACLEALRRTRSGAFDLGRSVPLQALLDDPRGTAERAVRLEALLPEVPGARLTPEGRERVAHGREIERRHVAELHEAAGSGIEGAATAAESGWVRLLGPDGDLLGLATPAASPGALHPCVVLI